MSTLAELGEQGILDRLLPRLGGPGAHVHLGPGDDAAVLGAPDGRMVVSTDVLVENRDFRTDWSTGTDVGVKAAAQNLSDINAMGGTAHSLVVGLVAPGSTPVDWVLDLADGLAAACAPIGAGVVGGDLSSGTEIAIAVTVLGDLAGLAPVTRSGARPGDLVAHAGLLGRSAAGLALLQAGRPDLDPGLVRDHRRPQPPLLAGPAAARAGAHALIDLSDGMLRDAGRVAAASGVDLELDTGPGSVLGHAHEALLPAAHGLGGGVELAWEWVLGGGEDHGLLGCFPPGTVLPDGFEVIGSVSGPGGRVRTPGVHTAALGWDHYAGTRETP